MEHANTTPEWLIDILMPACNALARGCTFQQLLEGVWNSLLDSLKHGKNALAAREAIVSRMQLLGIPQARAEELAKDVVARPFGIVSLRPLNAKFQTLRLANIPERSTPEPAQDAPRKSAQRSGNTLFIIPEAPPRPPVSTWHQAKAGKPCNAYLMAGSCEYMDTCPFDHSIRLDPEVPGVPGSTSLTNVSPDPCHTYLVEGWCRFGDGCMYTHYKTLPAVAGEPNAKTPPAVPRATVPAAAVVPPGCATPTPPAEPAPPNISAPGVVLKAAAPGNPSPPPAPRTARRQKFVPISVVLAQSPWGARPVARPSEEQTPQPAQAPVPPSDQPHYSTEPEAGDGQEGLQGEAVAPEALSPLVSDSSEQEAASPGPGQEASPPPAPVDLGPSFTQFILTAHRRDSPGQYLCDTSSHIEYILGIMEERRFEGLIPPLSEQEFDWRFSPSTVQVLYTKWRTPVDLMQQSYNDLCNQEPLDVEAMDRARLELRLARWQSAEQIFRHRNKKQGLELILDKTPRVADFQGLHLTEALAYLAFAIQRLQRVANHAGRFQLMNIITGSAPLSKYSKAIKHVNRIHIALATDLLARDIYFREDHNLSFLYLSFRVEPREVADDV
ncbi:hypothetical protein H696_01010 [Fonticula alba]|uniref:C3H1-type domain-containing protein n=1 Tax=Fonticula alba TaxID=691883 RepID=A0A058ZHP4_FONAL|nr:hypothetical protein H696_01010 [Fonticula alba]KCV73471.1 hypothetical protein H696_01010 [Fonticula alba]|eukprot:XP_009493172.1 hypothetical protein H696_01010 [Fonticula alba]